MFKTFLRIIEWVEETIIAYILAGMVIIAFTNAVLRRLFDLGFFWSLETTLLLFLILVLFGMPYAARKSLHIGVDALVNILPKKPAKIANITAAIPFFILSSVFLTTGGAARHIVDFAVKCLGHVRGGICCCLCCCLCFFCGHRYL